MSLKIISGSIIAIVIIGGQVYTSWAYNNKIEQQIDQFKANPGGQNIALDYHSISSGLFSTSDELTVTVTESQLKQLGMPVSHPLSVIINNDCLFLPFYVTCESTIAANNDATLELATLFEDLEYEAGWSLNILFGSLSSSLNINSAEWDREDGSIKVLPLELTTDSNIYSKDISIDGQWDGMKLNLHGEQGVLLEIAMVGLSVDLQQTKDEVLVGESRFNIQQMAFEKHSTGESGHLSNIDYASVTRQHDALYEISQTITTDQIEVTMQTMGLASQVMSDIKVDMMIDGLTADALQYVNQPGRNSVNTQQKLTEFEKAFGSQPHTLTVSHLDFVYNNVPFTFSGEVYIPEFSSGQMQNLAKNSDLKASATITMGNSVTSLPAYPLVQSGLNRWFIRDNDKFISRLLLENKTLTANGNVVSALP